MRKKAVVTESSTWFAALGLKTLKEQETTLRERIGRDGAQLSDETMIFFLYGSKNDIDGLAALGKYLTVFLPNSHYVKMVVELSNLANDRVMPLRSQNPVFRLNTSLKLATVFTKSIVRHTT